MKHRTLISLLVIWGLILCSCINKTAKSEKWNIEKAHQWSAQRGWLRGCNFIPSTAINQLEMWQGETFDTLTINRELGWAEQLGFNVMRVFLHHIAWEQDPEGFKDRMEKYLEISSRHDIQTMFVFFDDCWNYNAKSGKQPSPKPGIHNSGWVQDPGQKGSSDTVLFPELELYVKDIMNHFAHDKRVVMWDLYNEPGNTSKADSVSIVLLKKVFQWARETKALQPLTSGIWNFNLKQITAFQLANSDIISYHCYGDSLSHKKMIDTLLQFNRPLICSEYMARPLKSTFQTILPLLKSNNIGAINWGFVSGKTNTIYGWNDSTHMDGSEPAVWHHDIYRKDKTPYSEGEIEFLKKLNLGERNK